MEARLVGETLLRRNASIAATEGAERVDSMILRGFTTYPVTMR
jgi:hypothetical protein